MPTTLELQQGRAAVARSKKGRKRGRGKKHTFYPPVEAIDPQKTYPVTLIPELFGIGKSTLRDGEALGIFRPDRVGVRKYISGLALIQFIRDYQTAKERSRS